MFRDLGDESVVVEVAGCGEDHVAGCEAAGIVVEDDLLGEAGDGLGGTEDRAAEWVTLPEVMGKGFVDEIVGVILILIINLIGAAVIVWIWRKE